MFYWFIVGFILGCHFFYNLVIRRSLLARAFFFYVSLFWRFSSSLSSSVCRCSWSLLRNGGAKIPNLFENRAIYAIERLAWQRLLAVVHYRLRRGWILYIFYENHRFRTFHVNSVRRSCGNDYGERVLRWSLRMILNKFCSKGSDGRIAWSATIGVFSRSKRFFCLLHHNCSLRSGMFCQLFVYGRPFVYRTR